MRLTSNLLSFPDPTHRTRSGRGLTSRSGSELRTVCFACCPHLYAGVERSVTAYEMLQKYNTEDVISLVIAASLLGSYFCFVKFLINANLKAWSIMSKDKVAAIKNKTRTPEKELLCDAWFGGPCGVVAMRKNRHKVRKCEFLLHYYCRCCAGVCIVVMAHVVYLIFALPHIVHYWPAARHVMLHFVEWSEELRSTVYFWSAVGINVI